MKSVHLVIPDLFLPEEIAAEACAGLALPALEKMLGRGHGEVLGPVALENILCEMFGMSTQDEAPIAPISAAFDGLEAGCWLRADPVNLNLQRDKMLLAGVLVSGEEAAAMCASLNAHFAAQNMEFFAPHPQRWYVRLKELPRIGTTPLSQVTGSDVRRVLPGGADAARWHQLFNEIQMLLHAHPLNESREQRGESPVNSVWFWGAGCSGNLSLKKNFDYASSDEALVEMLTAAADIPFASWAGQWRVAENHGGQLLVWTGLRSALQHGDLVAWRDSLQDFEGNYARPIWQALRSGKIASLQLDVLGMDNIQRVALTRGDAWAFWRRARRLSEYSMV